MLKDLPCDLINFHGCYLHVNHELDDTNTATTSTRVGQILVQSETRPYLFGIPSNVTKTLEMKKKLIKVMRTYLIDPR